MDKLIVPVERGEHLVFWKAKKATNAATGGPTAKNCLVSASFRLDSSLWRETEKSLLVASIVRQIK